MKQEAEQTLFGGWDRLTLGNGGTLALEVDPQLGLRVVRRSADDKESERMLLPYPKLGFGGHAFVPSPDATRAALFLYSGQSEMGYEVFALEPALRHLGGLPYQYGMGSAPAFSRDGRELALCGITNSGLYVDEAELAGPAATDVISSEQTIPLGWIHVAGLTGQGTRMELVVKLAPGSPLEREDRAEAEIRELTRDRLELALSWGEVVSVKRPLPEQVVVNGPNVAGGR